MNVHNLVPKTMLRREVLQIHFGPLKVQIVKKLGQDYSRPNESLLVLQW